MSDIKTAVANNIVSLRKASSMTQLELAERLNYSDKAVSKWERAEALPDIATLLQISQIFGVTIDYLVTEQHDKDVAKAKKEKKKESRRPRYNHGIITIVSIMLVWLIALFIFVMLSLFSASTFFRWMVFAYTVPVCSIVWLVFNSVWFNKKLNYFIISLLMWSLLAIIHLSLLPFGMRIHIIYLLGIPGQIIILLWSFVKKSQKPETDGKQG